MSDSPVVEHALFEYNSKYPLTYVCAYAVGSDAAAEKTIEINLNCFHARFVLEVHGHFMSRAFVIHPITTRLYICKKIQILIETSFLSKIIYEMSDTHGLLPLQHCRPPSQRRGHRQLLRSYPRHGRRTQTRAFPGAYQLRRRLSRRAVVSRPPQDARLCHRRARSFSQLNENDSVKSGAEERGARLFCCDCCCCSAGLQVAKCQMHNACAHA